MENESSPRSLCLSALSNFEIYSLFSSLISLIITLSFSSTHEGFPLRAEKLQTEQSSRDCAVSGGRLETKAEDAAGGKWAVHSLRNLRERREQAGSRQHISRLRTCNQGRLDQPLGPGAIFQFWPPQIVDGGGGALTGKHCAAVTCMCSGRRAVRTALPPRFNTYNSSSW